MARAPVVHVYGPSGSGKTRLVERLVKELAGMGWRVATVKRSRSERLDVDTEGKDTWRHAQAGAALVAATSKSNAFVMAPRELPTSALLATIEAIGGVDLVIVEGLGADTSPTAAKIAVGEVPERAPGTILDVLDGDAHLVPVVEALERVRATADGRGEAVELEVGGRHVPIKGFVQDFLEGTLRGAISSLHDSGEAGEEVVLRLPPRKG